MLIFSVAILVFASIAWFTMNKGVSETGLQIMVSVPAGLQISIGKTQSGIALNNSDDYLALENNEVVTPTTAETDWSSSILVGNYYAFGKLMPASSTTGEHIFFTPDSARNGRYLKTSPSYYQADGTTDGELKTPTDVSDTNSCMTTAHALQTINGTKESVTSWENSGYTKSTSWKNTNDDGYYVDVPIWIRSSSATTTNLKIQGTVTKGTNTADNENEFDSDYLFKATRVAVLKESGTEPITLIPAVPITETAGGIPEHYANVLPLKDSEGHTVLDSKNFTVTRDLNQPENPTDQEYGIYKDEALYAIYQTTGLTAPDNYQQYYPYDPDDNIDNRNVICSIPANAGGGYGTPQKLILRIWLDGEDENCWNPNAGQDWMINLTFSTID